MAMEEQTMDSASHKFRIDYEQAKQLAIGVAVHSDAFTAGGHMWMINLYPRGISSDNGQFLSIYFELLNRTMTTNVSAIFDAFFISKGGQPSSTTPKRSNVLLFRVDGGVWGWNRFISIADLEENHVSEGNIWLVCAVMVVKDNSIPVPPSEIGKHLGKLLDSADGTDVSFVIGGQTFHAHRALLAARSPVFSAELLGSMAEATMSSIALQGINPQIFKLMLQFMYTDALPEDHDLGDLMTRMKTHMQLLAAADRYALDRLKLLCAKKLWDNMIPGFVPTTLAWADTHNCQELKSKCLDFMVAGEYCDKRVFMGKGYVDLVTKYPHLIDEMRERSLSLGHHKTPPGAYM